MALVPCACPTECWLRPKSNEASSNHPIRARLRASHKGDAVSDGARPSSRMLPSAVGGNWLTTSNCLIGYAARFLSGDPRATSMLSLRPHCGHSYMRFSHCRWTDSIRINQRRLPHRRQIGCSTNLDGLVWCCSIWSPPFPALL
jgi:hypothetical protein